MSGFDISGGMAAAGTALTIASSLGLISRIDPALACNFTVEIDGLIVGGFSEVSGLDAKIQTLKVIEGGQNQYQDQRVNGATFPNLVLKRGITTADMLWQWHRDVLAGTIKRRNGSIVLVTSDLTEMWRWNFREAYPVSWSGPAFKADQAQVAFESIELVHRGLAKDTAVQGAISAGLGAAASIGVSF